MLTAQLGLSQLTIRPIIKSEKNTQARESEANTVNQATLPFWDDFSISTDSVDAIRIWGTDSTRQWNYNESKDVYVNATLAINPPTYNVVTFDGLDVNGGFHNDTNTWGDQLQSDTIDLQGKAGVVLSFYWQAGGNVELPEEGDSLRLQFYNPNANGEKWITQWLVDGASIINGEDTVFIQKAVEVTSEYLTQKFLFRFQSFGDKDGPFDAWHLDWIYLNENRQNEDYYYLDRGLTGQITSPISPFKSMPPHQFKSNEAALTTSQFVQGFNLDEQLQATEYILVIRNLNSGARIDSIEYGTKAPLFNNPDPFKVSIERFIELDGVNLSGIPLQDSIQILSEVYLESSDDDFLDNTSINLRINDTIRTQYLLHNYYAFDDGTAEYAAGTNVNGGQIAIKFWLEEPDTLTHVDIHFPNIDPVSANSPLELRIFDNLDDEPIRKQNILVENASAINQFTRYELARPLLLSADTFYVGYQQSKNEYIGIGFDRSSPEASRYIYENKSGQWEQNMRLSGALMIRPVFAKVDSLILGTNPKEKLFKVYPNPTNGILQIEGKYEAITLIDFSGRILVSEESKSLHDFSSLKAGLYLLTIHRKEGDQTLKIIKK
jgi:hypothetical protein